MSTGATREAESGPKVPETAKSEQLVEKYLWWAPTLGALAFLDSKPCKDGDVEVKSGVVELSQTEASRSGGTNGGHKATYCALPCGVYAFEIANSAPRAAKSIAADQRSLAKEASRLVSEELGHLHIFHHERPPKKTIFEVVTRHTALYVTLLCVSLSVFLFDIQVLKRDPDNGTPLIKDILDIWAQISDVVPSWITGYIILFAIIALYHKIVDYFFPSKIRFYFFRVLNITSAWSLVLWVLIWGLVNHSKWSLPYADILMTLKPRLFLGHIETLSIGDLISAGSAAALLGLLARPVFKTVSSFLLGITRNGPDQPLLEFAPDIPAIKGAAGISTNAFYQANKREILRAIAQAHETVLRAFVQYIANSEAQENQARTRLAFFRNILSYTSFGVVFWIVSIILIASLTGDPRMDRFGGTNVLGVMIVFIMLSLGFWGVLLQRTIKVFSEPNLFLLQKFHGYFAYLDPFSDLLIGELEKNDPLVVHVCRSFSDTREIIKVKLDSARSRLEHGRASTTLSMTLTGVLAGAFIAIFGAQLKGLLPS